MLGMVIELAAVYELDSVEVWNLDEELKEVAKDLKGSEVEREEHLPAVKWYGKEKVEDVKWRFNEKSVTSSSCEVCFLTLGDSIAGFAGAELVQPSSEDCMNSRKRKSGMCTT